MNYLNEFLSSITAPPVIIISALIGALVTLYVRRINHDNTVLAPFVQALATSIADIKGADNINRDAFDVLQPSFDAHYGLFLAAYEQMDVIRKYRMKKAWQEYYGEEGEQEWFLPNEYSVIQSNQLKNTASNTRILIIHRLSKLIKSCK